MSEAAWTFPGPILDMLAKGLDEMDGGEWSMDGWRHEDGRHEAREVRIKTDSGWVTIRRLEGT